MFFLQWVKTHWKGAGKKSKVQEPSKGPCLSRFLGGPLFQRISLKKIIELSFPAMGQDPLEGNG